MLRNDTDGLRKAAAAICAEDRRSFKPDLFGGTANEVAFQAWYNEVLGEDLPRLGACRMYARRPLPMAAGGMGRGREDGPVHFVVGMQSWIPTELKPLSRVKENYSTLELEGRRQALSFAGKMLKVAAIDCGAAEAWALSMSANILGVELHLLEVGVAANRRSACLRSAIGERQPLLPAGVALDIWDMAPRTEKNPVNIEYIRARLKDAFENEVRLMCSKHSRELEGRGGKKKERIGLRSRVSLAAHRCEDCRVPPPGGLALLLRLLRTGGAICSPFWETLGDGGVLGRFLGIGASAAVFCSGPEPTREVVKVFLHANADRVSAEQSAMEALAAVQGHGCRVSRFVRRISVHVAGQERAAFVMTPLGVPLPTRVRDASSAADVLNDLAQVVPTSQKP